jgi:antitoxin component YwqK of YwqJK toxin-antitoxin module
MKWQFFLLLSTILVFGYSCTSDDINDSSKRNTKWAWWVGATTHKGRWIPLCNKPTWKNGTFTKFYFDGKIASKGTIKDGKYADTTFWFDRTGSVYAYKLNSTDSLTDFYVSDGPIKVYDIDGKIKMEGVIRNHKPGDKWTDYYKTGFAERIINNVNDTGWTTHYYENGQIKDSLFGMGKFYLTLGQWNANGQRIFLAGIRNHHYDGEILKYYDNGELMQNAFYSNGKVNGKGFYYWPTGKIQKEYNFIDSLQEGQNLEYYENGKVQNDLLYKNGKLDGEQKAYDEKGNLIANPYYKDGAQIK